MVSGAWLGAGVAAVRAANEVAFATTQYNRAETVVSQSVILCNRNTTPGPIPLWEQTQWWLVGW